MARDDNFFTKPATVWRAIISFLLKSGPSNGKLTRTLRWVGSKLEVGCNIGPQRLRNAASFSTSGPLFSRLIVGYTQFLSFIIYR